jgi:hypothetical protein
MRCNIDGTQGRDMILCVIGLVGARRGAMTNGLAPGFQNDLRSNLSDVTCDWRSRNYSQSGGEVGFGESETMR